MIRLLFGAALGGVVAIAIMVVMLIALVTHARVVLPPCPATPQPAMICVNSTATTTTTAASGNDTPTP